MAALEIDEGDLDEMLGQCADYSTDPLGFVRWAFPWGEGELAEHAGPDEWQTGILTDIGAALRGGASATEAVQIAVASGHGIGKSALVSWVILWAMCTFEDTRGVVTANTESQLRTKTWAELSKWHRRCVPGLLFECTATAIYSRDKAHEKTWRIDAAPWSERNTEAFAGLHNKGKRVLLVFDEASAIPDIIWETAEGALTDSDTEIVWCVFGNPTRNTGRFRECFGRFRHRWKTRQIDSRTARMTNKAQLAQWVADYGEDSDFVRIRVRGVFPRAGSNQFIPSDAVEGAQAREVDHDRGAPLIMGVDVARFGDDKTVCRFRRGRDARTIPKAEWRKQDTHYSAHKVAELIDEHKPDAVFIDGGGIGGGIVDTLKAMNYRVIEINFGGTASNEGDYFNKRAEMWGLCRDWLPFGAIDDDRDLSADLIGPEYGFDKDGRIQLEKKEDMKKRGLASPDDGDALVLTFARPVARLDIAESLRRGGTNRQAVVDDSI